MDNLGLPTDTWDSSAALFYPLYTHRACVTAPRAIVRAAPLSVLSAVVMALRFEIRQRIKRIPTAEVEEALRHFEQLQVRGVERTPRQSSNSGARNSFLELGNWPSSMYT